MSVHTYAYLISRRPLEHKEVYFVHDPSASSHLVAFRKTKEIVSKTRVAILVLTDADNWQQTQLYSSNVSAGVSDGYDIASKTEAELTSV